MLDWITMNASSLQLAVSVLTGVVWLAYFHILWLNFRRQRQAGIMINRSIARDEKAHCFVTNMGAEPIYLMEIMARVVTDDKDYNVKVTEREEVALDQGERLPRPDCARGRSRRTGTPAPCRSHPGRRSWGRTATFTMRRWTW